MENPIGQKQLLAILLTDVVNFSDQAAKNEEQTLRQLEQDFSLIQRQCRDHGGEVLKSTGDGILVSFSSSERALAAAEQAQKSLVQQGGRLSHRIGIHAGDVYRQEKDVLGDGVNLSARLTEIAESGGICVSEAVHHSTRSRHGEFHIRPVRGRIRNAPRDFRAYHFRLASLKAFYRPTPAGLFRSLAVLLLGFSFLISPTLVGFEALSYGSFQTEPFFLAGLSVAQYPAGIFLGLAFWGNQGGRPGREALRRVALGFCIYAGLAGWLLSLLATAQNPPRVAEIWPWLFLLQAAVGLACRWTAGRLRPVRPALTASLLWLSVAPCMAELQPSLQDFQHSWGAAVKRGRDATGCWQDFKKSREWVRVWTGRQQAVLKIQYRLPDYASCWTADRLGEKADFAPGQAEVTKIGVWEKDHLPPVRSSTPRFSTEYWARRDPAEGGFSAYAVVADEMTSIWMLPPLVILVPFTTDLGRPITLTIRSREALPMPTRAAGTSMAEARRSFRP